MRLLLIPLLLVVILQGVLPFYTLIISGTKQTMEKNAIELDQNIVENRKVVLESAMVDQWSGIRKESSFLNTMLRDLLKEKKADMDRFLSSGDLQEDFAQQAFPELLDYLRRDNTCGIFLILANNQPIREAGSYTGFFLRDSDPNTKTETNSDLLLERGSKALARQAVDTFRREPAGTFQLILMDVMMPNLDGLEAAHQIRTMGKEDSRTIPIVAASANAFDEDIKRSLASGMNAHLSKPIEPDKLAEMLSQMLA